MEDDTLHVYTPGGSGGLQARQTTKYSVDFTLLWALPVPNMCPIADRVVGRLHLGLGMH